MFNAAYILRCTAILLSLGLGISCLTAAAQDELNDALHWEYAKYNYSFDGRDAGSAPDFVEPLHVLRLKGQTADILLYCGRKSGVSAAIAMDPSYEIKPGRQTSPGQTTRLNGWYKIGNAKKTRTKWAYNFQSKLMVVMPRRSFLDFYNAAVKKQPIAFRALAETQPALIMPEHNKDFKAFAKACPRTNGDGLDKRSRSHRTGMSQGPLKN